MGPHKCILLLFISSFFFLVNFEIRQLFTIYVISFRFFISLPSFYFQCLAVKGFSLCRTPPPSPSPPPPRYVDVDIQWTLCCSSIRDLFSLSSPVLITHEQYRKFVLLVC